MSEIKATENFYDYGMFALKLIYPSLKNFSLSMKKLSVGW